MASECLLFLHIGGSQSHIFHVIQHSDGPAWSLWAAYRSKGRYAFTSGAFSFSQRGVGMVLALVLLLETANLACMRFLFIRHNGVD